MKEFFVFRLNKLKIINNREWHDGELKLLSFVTGNDVNLPALDDMLKTTDASKKKGLIKAAVESVLSSKILMQLDHVKDGHQATFGDTGYALYTSNKIPISFNWSLLVMEIDEDINTIGAKIDSVINSEFDGLSQNILVAAGAAVSPAAAAGVYIAKRVFGIIAGTMMENKDDQIGLAYQSFNRFEHYPHGERKRDNVPDLSNNLRIDYSIFGTTY